MDDLEVFERRRASGRQETTDGSARATVERWRREQAERYSAGLRREDD